MGKFQIEPETEQDILDNWSFSVILYKKLNTDTKMR